MADYSLTFNGSNAWKVDFGTPSSITSIASAVTLAAWVKPNLNSQANFGGQWKSSLTNLHFELGFGFTSNKFQFFVSKNGTSSSNSGASTTAADGNTWYHVVGVYDGSNIIIYVNGSNQHQAALTGNLNTTSATSFVLGSSNDGSTLTGKLDDVRLWSVALTPTQISDLYSYNIVSSTNLVGEWLFDEGSGSSALDTSGNNLTGTISNATYSTDTPPVALSINVSDSVTTNEYIDMLRAGARDLNVNDAVTMSENIQLLVLSFVNVNDASITSESVKAAIQTAGNVSDTATTSESINVLIPTLLIFTSDTTTIGENVVASQFTLIAVFDSSIITSENLQVFTELFVSVNDLTSVSDTITLLIAFLLISVFNRLFVTENMQLIAKISVFADTVIVSENLQIFIASDFIYIDSISITLPNPISLSVIVSSTIILEVIIE